MKKEKQALRRRMLALRDKTHDSAADQAMLKTLLGLDLYQKAACIAAYVSFGTEVDTHALIRQALRDKKRVAVPYCVPKSHVMQMLEISRFPEDLHPGTMDILEPDPEKSPVVDPSDIDCLIVPGVCFTEDGRRLGYGGGFYDRYLPKLAAMSRCAALVPEAMLVDSLPTESHDVRIPKLITERRIIDCLNIE
ncbi:5-formyltetrahydrofolate cyclo-ligase [Pseudoramibacter sp.]|jgi:5-formyltetrahydrofolate cyclo-ligase|uniref:5-formyltetrahydrofolate cyclo-ligase n=1 Tax=Pseudoramibacter sp. TaxID=2034862 RepID=UPI0025CFDDAC|nr:5-formyltetrahydrofolate cyclo-ligase [Pseudoramibacter sp.]MCH4071561.1 5-formyltetrahydrofolate cyclo-ligase [Pseudoramibacter sp.]MCH4105329.1 5-formyltetrahydrofolate cyclo-ligase [Pseudoramibacter sp.]